MSFNVVEIVHSQIKEIEEFLLYLKYFLWLIGVEIYEDIAGVQEKEILLVRFASKEDLLEKDEYSVFQIENNQKKSIEGFFKLVKQQGYLTEAEFEEIGQILDLYFTEKFYKTAFFLNDFFLVYENEKIWKQARSFVKSLTDIIFKSNNWEDNGLIRTKYAALRVMVDINNYVKKLRNTELKSKLVLYDDDEILKICQKIALNNTRECKIPLIFFLMAQAYNDIKETHKAYEYCIKYEKIGFQNSRLLLLEKGRCCIINALDYDKAIYFYDKARILYKSDVFTRLMLFRCYQKKRDLKKKREALEEAELILLKKLETNCLYPREFYSLIKVEINLCDTLSGQKLYGKSLETAERIKKILKQLDNIIILSEDEEEKITIKQTVIQQIPFKTIISLRNTMAEMCGLPKEKMWTEKFLET